MIELMHKGKGPWHYVTLIELLFSYSVALSKKLELNDKYWRSEAASSKLYLFVNLF